MAFQAIIPNVKEDQSVPVSSGHSITIINEVILAFVQHARHYYSAGREYELYKSVLRLLRECYGELLVQHFGPKALKVVRTKMVEKNWCRRVVNRQITRLRTMFKWAESEEFVPAGTTHALATVSGLKRGEQGVRESRGVEPVFWEQLSQVLPHCSRTIQAMLQLQFLTGMRSGEVRIMRKCDIDTSDPACWYYRPASHKNSWRESGQQRVVPLGPKCQEIIGPWLAGAATNAYIFDPKIALEEFDQLRPKKKKPTTVTEQPRTTQCYSSNTYAQAVTRACKKAGVSIRPYGLRHGRKMLLEKELGSEAARVVLGQKSIQSTQHYGKLDVQRAAEIMKQVG
ncbi:MAG TPA: tyrosine-type recombinase/integrase [Gemmatales bacterium]|nr:tyrosine-type recombinase/integrase [Gemmatales bacterium]